MGSCRNESWNQDGFFSALWGSEQESCPSTDKHPRTTDSLLSGGSSHVNESPCRASLCLWVVTPLTNRWPNGMMLHVAFQQWLGTKDASLPCRSRRLQMKDVVFMFEFVLVCRQLYVYWVIHIYIYNIHVDRIYIYIHTLYIDACICIYIYTWYTAIPREFARVGATKKHMRDCREWTNLDAWPGIADFFTSTRVGFLEQFFTRRPFDNKIRYQPWLGDGDIYIYIHIL